ncbi:MAG: hypothetical protein ACR2NH_07475 [Solirubrobacteraceae bacterium]
MSDLAVVERDLRARHAELHAKLTGLAEPPEAGAGVDFGKRIGDGTTEAVSRLTDVGVGGSLEASAGASSARSPSSRRGPTRATRSQRAPKRRRSSATPGR